MAFAVVFDVAASWQRYAGVAAEISDPAPVGLIVLAAGPTDEGVRVISVWEDENSWRRFQIERLAPSIASLDGPAPCPPVERRLDVVELALGEANGRARRVAARRS